MVVSSECSLSACRPDRLIGLRILAYFGAPGAHDATASTAEVTLMRLTLSLMNRPRITTVWSFIGGRLNSLMPISRNVFLPAGGVVGMSVALRLVGDARHRIGGGHQHPVGALLAQAAGDADDVDLLGGAAPATAARASRSAINTRRIIAHVTAIDSPTCCMRVSLSGWRSLSCC